jgi:hypothetical protein
VLGTVDRIMHQNPALIREERSRVLI